ncbi:hypothetical protein WJX79_006292 [Trebouxia sp. C0005]
MAPEEAPAAAPAEAVAEGPAPWQSKGLKEQYYLFTSGSFTKFPTALITGRKPNVTQYVTNIDFASQPGYWSNNTVASFWAAVFTGHIKLPVGGLWSFSLSSDDGSLLYIDGALFINNDGSHSATSVQSQSFNLTAGYHSIEVDYCNLYSAAELSLKWKGPTDSAYAVSTLYTVLATGGTKRHLCSRGDPTPSTFPTPTPAISPSSSFTSPQPTTSTAPTLTPTTASTATYFTTTIPPSPTTPSQPSAYSVQHCHYPRGEPAPTTQPSVPASSKPSVTASSTSSTTAPPSATAIPSSTTATIQHVQWH